MTILEKKVPSGTDAKKDVVAERIGLRTYLVVALVAAGIGVGAVFGANQLGSVGADRLTPAQIAEIRAAQFAEQAENVYQAQLAEIYEQRAQEMVELHSRQHQAWIDRVQEQRAQEMVESYSRQHQGWIDWVQEQRARDMVEFHRGRWEVQDGS